MQRKAVLWIAALGLFMLSAAYALLIWLTRGAAITEAIFGGTATAMVGALAAALVFRLGSRVSWRELERANTLAVHAGLAVLFSSAWSAAITGLIAIAGPREAVWFIANGLGWQVLLGMLLYGLLAVLAHLYQATRELHQSEAIALRAELHALRARLNPHFLFNTLHSIISLVRTDPDAVETALERFATLLRYVLRSSTATLDDVTLERELEFVRTYLELERLRFGSRLTVLEDVDEDVLDQLLPALTLQPLVENAIQHGIGRSMRGGTIRITARARSGQLSIVVTDSGPGSASGASHAGSGLGLDLVRRRLSTRYGARAALDLHDERGEGFTVQLRVPLADSALLAGR